MRGYFRKRGKYWSFTVDIGRDPETGKRKQKTVSGFKTKKEAEKACAELIAKIENGGYVEPKKVPFREFILDFMENHVKPTVRESTYATEMRAVKKHVIPELGNIPLAKINPMHLQKLYAKKREEGLSPHTISMINFVICRALRAAYKWKFIPENVAAMVNPPRKPLPDIKVWTIEEAKRFLKASEGRRYHVVYVLALTTGMRKGEILALKWEDVDLDNGWLSVRHTLAKPYGKVKIQEAKTKGARRTITLPEDTVAFLKKHKNKQLEEKLAAGPAWIDNGLVVCTQFGTPVDPGVINRDMDVVIRNAGLPRIRFHDLRHTHATMLLQLGENPKVVAERLGHADVRITLDIYSHVLPGIQENLARRLNEALKMDV